MRRTVDRAGREARYFADRAGSQATRAYQDQPLLVGGLGLVLGALTALALPATPAEDRALGPIRDRTLERGRRMAAAAADTAYRSADSAVRAAAERARAEGLSEEGLRRAGEEIGERARSIAGAAVEAGRQEVKSGLANLRGTSPAGTAD